MRITTNNIGLYSPDHTYQNHDPKVKTDEKLQTEQNNVKIADTYKGQKAENEVSHTKIFSNQELATLKALFGYENKNNQVLYGRNKLHNVHSGILLDVKG
jgi:hypothetical protein